MIGDPWRDATVSSEFSGSKSTALQPIALSDGFHCSDLLALSGTADPTILAVQNQALGTMHSWLSMYAPVNGTAVDNSSEAPPTSRQRAGVW